MLILKNHQLAKLPYAVYFWSRIKNSSGNNLAQSYFTLGFSSVQILFNSIRGATPITRFLQDLGQQMFFFVVWTCLLMVKGCLMTSRELASRELQVKPQDGPLNCPRRGSPGPEWEEEAPVRFHTGSVSWESFCWCREVCICIIINYSITLVLLNLYHRLFKIFRNISFILLILSQDASHRWCI